MNEYIARDSVLTVLDWDCASRDALNAIKAIPAADVVEVVRCADCKYDERCMFQSFVRDERVEPYDKTVFYCADGKRKDGGQDDV